MNIGSGISGGIVVAATPGLTRLTEAATNYLNSFIDAVPTILTAMVVMIVFWIAAGVAGTMTTRLSEQVTDDPSLKSLFGTIAQIGIIVVGALCTASILFPGLNAGDLVAVLGLSSVAVGFAFKDIFENFLAGILILLQRPFVISDHICVAGHEGIVEDINIRSTSIKTFDNERIIIPNSTIYSCEVRVRTAFESRRTTFQTGIGYDEDIEEGRQTIQRALTSCETILQEPAPQVLVSSHGDSAVVFDIRFWTNSREGNVPAATNEIATRVKEALDEADIEIPYPYRTVEFHDMSRREGDEPAVA